MSYGGARQEVAFFTEQGNTVFFGPLSQEYIYDRVLAPLLTDFDLVLQQTIAMPIMALYRHVVALDAQEVLISPRELSMIVLLVKQYLIRHPEVEVESVVKHYIYQIAKTLIPQKDFLEFEHLFKAKAPAPSVQRQESGDFYRLTTRADYMN